MKRLKTAILLSALFATILLQGCQIKSQQDNGVTGEEIKLTFYGLFDNSEIYEPIISSYETANPNVTIEYKKFTDPEKYMDLIINELAEGEGPDIFMMQNTWFEKHYKKLSPAPESIVNGDVFTSAFVDVTAKDLIKADQNGKKQVYGIPLYVDTLALYYNDDHFEEAIPSQGAPSTTWEGIKNDVSLLNREDQSFERFERAGIAMGRSDNILRAFDILMALILEYKVNLYDAETGEVIFDNDPNMLSALEFYTSFALPSQKNYSWNKYLADPNSEEKELKTFAQGKLSMLLGYSFTYEDILNEINILKSAGEDTIDPTNIKVQELPQIYDPETSSETRKTYANYFVPVVSRTSSHQEEAWKFLASMVTEENLRAYNQLTHRPSALRSLIKEQTNDPIYGIFATQVGYAESIKMQDPNEFKQAFFTAIDQILDTKNLSSVIKTLADTIKNQL